MRRDSGSLIVIATFLILGMLAPAMTAGAQTPGAAGPITVGVLAPMTGPFATFARDIVDGAQLYHDEVGGQMSGRKLQLVVEDYQVRPDVALTKIRKLVERDRAQAVVGIVLSSAALAVKDYVNTQKVPLLISGCATAEVLTIQPTPYVFRLTFTASMTGGPGGQWTYRALKARRAAIIASDSVGPIENMMAWARGFEEAGGKVVQEIYAPLGTADFAPYVAQLRRDVDVIGVQAVGADGVRFVKQFQEYGSRARSRWSTPRWGSATSRSCPPPVTRPWAATTVSPISTRSTRRGIESSFRLSAPSSAATRVPRPRSLTRPWPPSIRP